MLDPRIVSHHGVVPTLASDVFIADTARVIGDVHMGPGSSLWYGAVLRGDVFHIRVGARVNIQDMAMVHVTTDRFPTLIEDDVTVGHQAMLHGCTIKRGALIGMGAMIMDQAVIGEEALVAAGAVVTPGTIVEPRTLMVGSPARPRRPLGPEELENLAWSARHYAELAHGYRAGGHGVLGGGS
jgi:carbonic anhydrase/acetyltransferase-like protein (isoleucine patch superfamily)